MIEQEPTVSVGLMTGTETIDFELKDRFVADDGAHFGAGSYRARAAASQIEIVDPAGQPVVVVPRLRLKPADSSSSFVVRGVTIGIDFHWQRKQDQEFQGALNLRLDSDGQLIVINEIPIESYLTSVISSEMSADAHPGLLKAHSIISRSWLLAQMKPWKKDRHGHSSLVQPFGAEQQLIRWYGQESHEDFDVCADDHCQRYQGVTKVTSPGAYDAIRATFGRALVYGEELCDARYSKSCGGMTESFDAAWEDERMPYLAVSYDGETFPSEFNLPLSDEANAERWIRNSPPAFCHPNDKTVLRKILPDFDQETTDFYRWRVTIAQDELQELLREKLGVDFGVIRKLEPVERGASGRIVRLRIIGKREKMIIGKELEIRRALSPSHLYSSAFVVESDKSNRAFTLIGAGWGHGVGLCQIGAALMAERGYDFRQILGHYYRGAQLSGLYSASI